MAMEKTTLPATLHLWPQSKLKLINAKMNGITKTSNFTIKKKQIAPEFSVLPL